MTLDKVNFTQSVAQNQLIIDDTYELPSSLRTISTIYLIDSSKAIGVYDGQFYKTLDKRTGLFIVDPTTGDYKTERLPNIDFQASDSSHISYGHFSTRLNSRRSDISPSKKHLAIVMRYVPLLQVYKILDDSFEQTGSYYLNNNGPFLNSI